MNKQLPWKKLYQSYDHAYINGVNSDYLIHLTKELLETVSPIVSMSLFHTNRKEKFGVCALEKRTEKNAVVILFGRLSGRYQW